MQQYTGGGLPGYDEDGAEPASFDQTDKAEDAIDYEDFSEDDLPDEEEPTNTGGRGGDDEEEEMRGLLANSIPDALNARSTQPTTNGHDAPPPMDYSAMSPASMTSAEDEDGLDANVALQRRLFKDSRRRNAGEDVLTGPIDTDMELFHTLYPGYEEACAPRFVDLFPSRNVEYKGKAPLKPPKAVLPTKPVLSLLQDQERMFKAVTTTNKAGYESTFNNSIIHLRVGSEEKSDSDDELDAIDFDEDERIGGISMQDLALICQDWDAASIDGISSVEELAERSFEGNLNDGDWDALEQSRPAKKRKVNQGHLDVQLSMRDISLSFEEPERAVAKLAKAVALDLNDPNLLIDEHAPRTKRQLKRMPGDVKRDAALSRDIAKRYNISNDQAYDLLKENHQHKVRSTLGSMAVEHSFPATKLQFPFYKVALDNKAKRAFHRPQLDLKASIGKEYRFQKPKHIKKKNVRGKDAKEVFAKAEDLSLGDNASLLMLEYSEEAPMMLSNFGMGNRLINYYRKKDADDSTRPKLEIGEAQVLLTQDKSPFANFGHVDKGDTVPTIQNGLFRAPVFQHDAKPVDFIIGISSTWEGGDRLYLRNVENLHIVGQQFPLAEVPGQHSRKVTDAAKKRLRALAFRIYTKSQMGRRDKMREFMKYERFNNKGENGGGVWVPQPGNPVPDAETLRSWIRPEDVCLLDSMQVGVQHLADLGLAETKEAEEDKDAEEGSTNLELQLAPWRATKNFLNACQGKAMLTLHGEGDPTRRGEGFSFVKTSMKGGFQPIGESVNDKIASKSKKDNGGHSYNVAKQQKAYDDHIRKIWDAQRESLTNNQEHSDDDMEDIRDADGEDSYGRVQTPRSSFGTPAAFSSRPDDDYMSQFSGHSAGRGDRSLVIVRSGGVDEFGRERPEVRDVITNPAVIREYKKRQMEKQFKDRSIAEFKPTGDAEKDAFAKQQLEKELFRVKRNADRREAREKLKHKHNNNANAAAGSPAAGSPGPSDDGTARKCANCGQVGHIKTNRKLCPMLNGTMKPEDASANGDSSFGAVPAPLTL
ncbi:transcription initiation factor TFIID, subunit TAF1 [Zymoseptoria tritici IPO323]|uniref:Transcription initiation factor TFIID, subunit TAF1 n=1 Tax=Zymoseptoria tritici (strain CBS 115943 / IPO323) TaxID=336722 RepID=F9WYB3_ZYMTI|nr:transcription initiation factor TFIID, subunit TAF1 [Zymoseptoria tritici IPO323]EGP92118.1 transcription initiation factor TFIID, subunit TAF1 [Zymoseptoria tritici IPO323]